MKAPSLSPTPLIQLSPSSSMLSSTSLNSTSLNSTSLNSTSLNSTSLSTTPPSTLASSQATESRSGIHDGQEQAGRGGGPWSLVRGRTNTKRSHSTEENVCVVAFLVQGQKLEDRVMLEKIQGIRRRFDQAYRRWEPHLTLIPPFIIPLVDQASSSSPQTSPQTSADGQRSKGSGSEEHSILQDNLEDISSTIQSVCSRLSQHTLTLDDSGHFSLKRYNTFHLRPSPLADCDSFLALQRELHGALGQVKQRSRRKGKQQQQTYHPHLTLGQSYNAKVYRELQSLASEVVKTESGERQPLQLSVNKIQLMVKPVNRTGPYDVFREFNLIPPDAISDAI